MFRNETPSRNTKCFGTQLLPETRRFRNLTTGGPFRNVFFFGWGRVRGVGKFSETRGLDGPRAPLRLPRHDFVRAACSPPAPGESPGSPLLAACGPVSAAEPVAEVALSAAGHFAGVWPRISPALGRHWASRACAGIGPTIGRVAFGAGEPSAKSRASRAARRRGGGLSQVAPLPSQPSYGLPGNHPRRAWTGLVWTRKNGGGGQRKRRWHPLRGALVPMWHTSSDAPTSQEHDPRQVPCLRAHTPRRRGGALLRGAPPLGDLGAERLPTGAARNLWTGRPLQAAPGNARARETPPPPTPRAPARLRSSLPAHSLPPRARARIFFFFQWPHSLLGSRNTFCVFPDRFPFPALKHPSS